VRLRSSVLACSPACSLVYGTRESYRHNGKTFSPAIIFASEIISLFSWFVVSGNGGLLSFEDSICDMAGLIVSSYLVNLFYRGFFVADRFSE
jgi:hypothetical protein